MRQLTEVQWLLVRGVITEALARPPSVRQEFIRQSITSDDRALNYATDLIRVIGSRDDILEQPILEQPVATAAPEFVEEAIGVSTLTSHRSDRVGTKLKSFRLAARVGSGGMGDVYLAKREDGEFEQVVALKVLKKGLDTDEVLTRFEGERRILANLEHPNIARLLDGGVTPDGCPYYTMEFVDGYPINSYCDRLCLTIEERLYLFLMACDAVDYAHQHHVVHRDLKPGNLFVTNEGQVKLLDFGISKLVEGDERDRTLTVTRRFTPAYAAPEQVLGGAITAATDVYCLGLILFELMVGRLPDWNVTVEINPDLARLLRDAELASSTVHDQDPSVSRKRKSEPTRLRRLLRGDLDTIIAKALVPDPANRYESVRELQIDVEAFLEKRPIQARMPTPQYRLGKYIQRNRALVTVTLLIALAAAGLTAALVQKRAAANRVSMNWGTRTPIRPTVSVPEGFFVTVAYNDIVGPDGLVVLSNDELLVVKEYPTTTAGVYRASIGSNWHEDHRIDRGDRVGVLGVWGEPDDMVLAWDGNLYVADGRTVWKVALRDGGMSGFAHVGTTGSDNFNPFGIAIAPKGFDGPNVNPGDLVVGDNGYGLTPALWAVSIETGDAKRIASGDLLHPEFAPDGTLYAGSNCCPSTISIVKASGEVIPFLTEQKRELHMAIHPVTGDIYFKKSRNQIHRVNGDGSIELFADHVGGSQEMEFNKAGTRLYISSGSRQQVLEIAASLDAW